MTEKFKIKVVLSDPPGFHLNTEARDLYAKKNGFTLYHYEMQCPEFEIEEEDFLYTRVENSSSCCYVYSFKEDQGESFDEDRLSEIYETVWDENSIERTDPKLIEVVQELGLKDLRIVEIPDGVDWEIRQADHGYEWVSEKHREWH